MQIMFGLRIFLSENSILPVMLQSSGGGELTGYLASSVTISTSLNGAALATYTPAPSDWVELGSGLYELTIPAAELDAEGAFVYHVETNPNPDANLAFNGFCQVEHRLDQYVCHIVPQFSEVTLEFSALVWLTKNGQRISNPATCEIWMTDVNSNVPVHLTGASPDRNANGTFVLSASSVSILTSMAYEARVDIVDADANTWSNILGGISFN
jgi:hypothetical protein